MALGIVGTPAYSHYNSFAENAHTLSVTVPAGAEALVIAATINDYDWTKLTSITVNGSATGIVQAGTTPAAAANRSARVWYVLAPAAGTYNVVMTYTTSSGNGGGITAFCLAGGLDTTTPVGTAQVVSSGGATSPNNVTLTAGPTGSFAFLAAHGDTAQPTHAAGQTVLGTNEQLHSFSYKVDGTVMGVTFTGSQQLAMVGVVFNATAGGGDTTAPVLSSPVGTQTGATTATVGATTDEGNGTLYAVVTTSATQPSVAQIKAGQTHTGSAAPWSGSVAVSSTGAKTLNATGLTASTTYYAHLVHTDAASNDSNRVSSASFTTASLAGFDFHTAAGLIFGDLAGGLTGLARQTAVGMVLRVYAVGSGALVHESGTLTTDSDGRLARYQHASLSLATAYHCLFVRGSDGAIACAKLTTT